MALHVIPDADTWPHIARFDCWCGPDVDVVDRDDGSRGGLVVHKPADGREPIGPQRDTP
jgi:hypothetical protein